MSIEVGWAKTWVHQASKKCQYLEQLEDLLLWYMEHLKTEENMQKTG